MNHKRIYILSGILLAGLIGCQQRMTVVRAKLVERENMRSELDPPQLQEPTALRHYSNGLALLAAGDSTGSVEQFRLTLSVDSTIWSAHYLLGVLASASDPEDCLDHYRTALRFAPAIDSVRSRVYVAMANCYEQQAALGYAEQSYRMALKLYPFSDPAREGLDRIISRRQTNE